MNRNSKYQKSIADEFSAIKDRVEYFIENVHNGENGRYREIILMNYLKKILPEGIGVGTGFVRNREGKITKQIDIIVYRNSYPKLFEEGDFVIIMPESVLGIIEVKSRTTTDNLSNSSKGAIQKAVYNGKVVGNKEIFNGIFGFDTNVNFNHDFSDENLANILKVSEGYINHIAFNSEYFMRFWRSGNPDINQKPCFSFYDLSMRSIQGNSTGEGLAFGYFISNLLEVIYENIIPEALTRQYFEFLYPIEGTKERHRLIGKEVFIRE
ncbi:hypothetical protein AF331_17950 [Rossellomorea marisflavi]|uniref:DUF6602 domain-containing protein n=1 Tax=Rossellomorea marisflavi TaxID=189381 RepID=A0A0M0G0S1_9BACI|nr:DUF6602 domain-containing protein [Rossellomorea marisflavi]KON83378.1 hypothetical protein AF331_17950 [Rossellomorea marisflavi]